MGVLRALLRGASATADDVGSSRLYRLADRFRPSVSDPVQMRMERARRMGFDLDGYHSTMANFDEFVPNAYRRASFIARTPEDASRGATAGVRDGTGAQEGNWRTMPVRLRSRDVDGFRYSDAEEAAIMAMPERATEAEMNAVVRPFIEQNPNFDYWWRIYDEVEVAPGVYEYHRRPLPQIDWDTAEQTGRDVYGRQWPHWGGESGSADRALGRGFRSFAQQDESGLAIGVADPSAIRSRFAAFDPARSNSRDLLAGIAAPVAVGGALTQRERRR